MRRGERIRTILHHLRPPFFSTPSSHSLSLLFLHISSFDIPFQFLTLASNKLAFFVCFFFHLIHAYSRLLIFHPSPLKLFPEHFQPFKSFKSASSSHSCLTQPREALLAISAFLVCSSCLSSFSQFIFFLHFSSVVKFSTALLFCKPPQFFTKNLYCSVFSHSIYET